MREATMWTRDGAVTAPAGPRDATVGRTRTLSIAVLIALPCFWHLRTTGRVSIAALLLLAAIVLACVAFGQTFARLSRGLVPRSPGIAYEFLVGFLVGNTLLFVLILAAPWGIGWHLVILGASAAACAASHATRSTGGPRRTQEGEAASLVVLVLSGLFATLWVVDQQPVVAWRDGQVVFQVWYDVFIHVREISAFAQSHGLASLSDIKLAGSPAPVYHFASYMVPAALDALTGTSAIDAYAAFQLPFGILLTGLAAYALMAVSFRTTWPAVVAVAVLALPDAYQQGFGLHYLSYHFMSQVNLGMLYGIACIAIAWLLMVEACRRGRVVGVLLAYVFLAVCAMYKAHLFVANAALLMLYPCIFFGRFDRLWRVLAAGALAALFVTVVTIAQTSPRVPTLRLDGSGLRGYIDLLMGGFSMGRFRAMVEALYRRTGDGGPAQVSLSAALILSTSFGAWLAVVPGALWWQRRAIDRRVLAFIALVFVNYLVMSMGLALDERGVGAPEEFLNRPHAWAYFVVVAAGLTAAAMGAMGRERRPSRRAMVVLALSACALVAFVQRKAPNLQTFPEWGGSHARYDRFNAAPACLVRSATYIRDHARIDDLLQDSRFDERLMVTSIAERQAFVSSASFGGKTDIAAARVAALQSTMATHDERALSAWFSSHRVRWFVLQPEDADGWSGLLDKAAFACDGYRVFDFAGSPVMPRGSSAAGR